MSTIGVLSSCRSILRRCLGWVDEAAGADFDETYRSRLFHSVYELFGLLKDL